MNEPRRQIESQFSSWTVRVFGTLIAAATVGGVGLAIGQSSIDQRVKTNTQELSDRKHLTTVVPVLQNDIDHMQQEMQREHSIILDAIAELEETVRENGN